MVYSSLQYIMKQIALFASGSGSNAEKIVEHFKDSSKAQVKMILCNNPNAGVIARAERLNIPLLMFEKEDLKSGKITEILLENKIDLIVLAGFLWLIPKNLITAFPRKIINLHPALLPKYGGKGMYGHFVHEAVIANKEKKSGITIHYVNEHYDEGDVIFQAWFSISENDTVEDIALKGQILEHQHFPEVIAKLLRVK